MKLTKAEDTDYMYDRYVSEDGKIDMGIYPVIFGWRVYAGFVGECIYSLDYCCGNTQKGVEEVFSLVKAILEKHGNFGIFPFQERKPVFTDVNCYSKLIELAGLEYEKIKLSNIHALRPVIINKIFQNDN